MNAKEKERIKHLFGSELLQEFELEVRNYPENTLDIIPQSNEILTLLRDEIERRLESYERDLYETPR
jgi:hypothetical protein